MRLARPADLDIGRHLLREEGATHVGCATDRVIESFRNDLYPGYKSSAGMPPELLSQFPIAEEAIGALGLVLWPMVEFEADDAIATLVGQAEGFGFDTTILTGDLDMLQLVSEHTKLMVSLRGGIANTVAYDLAKIEERWGLRPEQMLDYKSLKGDPTDNIPGIPGVGEKTASKLIATWGTLDALYEHIDEVTPEKLRVPLEEHRESVLESRELMRLVRDVDVTLDVTAHRAARLAALRAHATQVALWEAPSGNPAARNSTTAFAMSNGVAQPLLDVEEFTLLVGEPADGADDLFAGVA